MTTTTVLVLVVVASGSSFAVLLLVARATGQVRELVDRTAALRDTVGPLLEQVTDGAERAGAHAARLGSDEPPQA